LLVTTFEELAVEYQKKINELTSNGWDQSKFQVILTWYQAQQVKILTSQTEKTEGFPEGEFFGGNFFFDSYSKQYYRSCRVLSKEI
jgi:hypothetical protein